MGKARTAKSGGKAAKFKQAAQAAGAGFAEAPQAAFQGEPYTSESTAHLIPALRNLKPSGAMPVPSYLQGKLPPIGD
ncbi:MAG: hypothetical protein ACLPIX_00005, partial [Rhodomicrobium sp.]